MADDDDHNSHPETPVSPSSTNGAQSATKLPKDRQCPFCAQPFTSSSLGRHLDLYIRPKNPKPADGIHDIEEIKQLRGGVTRRQPRTNIRAGSSNSNGLHRQSRSASNKATREREKARLGARVEDNTPFDSPVNAKDGPQGHTFINKANWMATGVINDLPPRVSPRNDALSTGRAPQRIQERRPDAGSSDITRAEYESDSHGVWKQQEVAELGRAAELALREVLGSLEAASKRAAPRLLYDEFDFYALSFPGLCLAMLPAPRALFSPTPFPCAESWTLGPPGLKQFEMMTRVLNERVALRRKTEYISDTEVSKHHNHLSGAWEYWEARSEHEQISAWQLEIMRSFARAQERTEQLKSELEQSQQHSLHLEAEYDRLSRCQLPREYLLHPPNTIPISSATMREVRLTDFDPTADAEALIQKWRSTIKATTRSSKISQTPSRRPTQPEDNSHAHQPTLREDMVMNGAIWSVNGPLPRNGAAAVNSDAFHRHDPQSVIYETTPQPGAVVGAGEDDARTDVDADAEGEVDEDGPYDYANHPQQQHDYGGLTKRRRVSAAAYHKPESQSPGHVVGLRGYGPNPNGKHPFAATVTTTHTPTTNTTSGKRLLKERSLDNVTDLKASM